MQDLSKIPITFDFTKEEYENIKSKLMLNEELTQILEMKIYGCSIVEISMKLHRSERTINRRVKLLKKMIKKVI